MEPFTTRYEAQVSKDKENWIQLSYTCEHTCRDSAIYGFASWGDVKIHGSGTGDPRLHHVKDIKISLKLQQRVSDSYPIFKELAEVFKVQYAIEKKQDEFGGRVHNWIQFFGNDKTVLMVWYWAVLAMRRGIVNQEGDFYTRMRETGAGDDYTWDCEEDYEDSLIVWNKWVQEGIGPTSQQMIDKSECPINWHWSTQN